MFLSNQKLFFASATLVLIAPILANYRVSHDLPINIGDILVVILVPILIFSNLTSNHLKLAKTTILFLALFLVTVFVNVLDLSQIKYFIYVALFFITISLKENYNLALQFFSLYSKIGCLISIFLVLQFTTYHLFDHRLILNLPLNMVEIDTLNALQDQFRPGSVFREPSYFVLFISPLVFFYSKTKQYSKYFLVIIAAIFSTSSLIIPVIIFERLNNYFNSERNFKLNFFYFFGIILLGYLFKDSIIITRSLSSIAPGGTFYERFIPGFVLAANNLTFFSNTYLHNLLYSESVWINSFAFLALKFGTFFAILISASLFTFDFFIAFLLLFFLLSTSFFLTPFATLIFFAFSQLENSDKIVS